MFSSISRTSNIELQPLSTLNLKLEDNIGNLQSVLTYFKEKQVSLCSIYTRPSNNINNNDIPTYEFECTIEGHTIDSSTVLKCINDLNNMPNVECNPSKNIACVPWFPKDLVEFNFMGVNTMQGGVDLFKEGHPGFHDPDYVKRRNWISELGEKYKLQDERIPNIDYLDTEKQTWRTCYNTLVHYYPKLACQEYLQSFEEFQNELQFGEFEIPQMNAISEYTKKKTGFRFKPVAGLLSQREFLNGLAFRVFYSVQFIRHHSEPMYSPEPDIMHEYMGHSFMFANKDYADFSQMIGMASLGADANTIKMLGSIYWYTIEFGLMKEQNDYKIFGAGLLGWSGEMERLYKTFVTKELPPIPVREFDPHYIAYNDLDLELIEPHKYFYAAENFKVAREQLESFTRSIPRQFNASFNVDTYEMKTDRPLKLYVEKL